MIHPHKSPPPIPELKCIPITPPNPPVISPSGVNYFRVTLPRPSEIYTSGSLLGQFIGLFFGAFIIIELIWRRGFRQVFPKDLTIDQIYSFRFFIVLYTCIISLIVLWYCIKDLLKTDTATPNYLERKFPKLYAFINRFILNAHYSFFVIVYHRFNRGRRRTRIKLFVERIRMFMEKWGILDMGDHAKGFRQALIITILLIYLPRIIVLSVFVYEIAINKRLELFYQLVVILFIPMTITSLRCIFLHTALWDLGLLHAAVLHSFKTFGLNLQPSEELQHYLDFLKNGNYLEILETVNEMFLNEILNEYRPLAAGKIRYPSYIVINFNARSETTIEVEEHAKIYDLFIMSKRMELHMSLLYEAHNKYKSYYRLLVSSLFLIGILLWLLIIIGWY